MLLYITETMNSVKHNQESGYKKEAHDSVLDLPTFDKASFLFFKSFLVYKTVMNE